MFGPRLKHNDTSEEAACLRPDMQTSCVFSRLPSSSLFVARPPGQVSATGPRQTLVLWAARERDPRRRSSVSVAPPADSGQRHLPKQGLRGIFHCLNSLWFFNSEPRQAGWCITPCVRGERSRKSILTKYIYLDRECKNWFTQGNLHAGKPRLRWNGLNTTRVGLYSIHLHRKSRHKWTSLNITKVGHSIHLHRLGPQILINKIYISYVLYSQWGKMRVSWLAFKLHYFRI